MDDQNPLKVYLPLSSSVTNKTNSNKSGRPTFGSIIKFGPQPKSMVAQMLSKLNEKNTDNAKKQNVYFSDKNSLTYHNSTDLIITKGDQGISCSAIKSTLRNHSTSTRGNIKATKNLKCKAQPNSVLAKLKTKVDVSDNDDGIIIDPPEIVLEVNTSEDISSRLTHSTSTEELKRHIIKQKEFICDFPNCGYSCKLSSNLIKHRRVHTNEKPYLCEKCSFRSNFVNSLKAHKRTHTFDRPYKCMHCSYKCNSSSNLKKHCLHKHPNTPNN